MRKKEKVIKVSRTDKHRYKLNPRMILDIHLIGSDKSSRRLNTSDYKPQALLYKITSNVPSM